MATKRIFILNGHPAARSLSRAIAEAYAEAARSAGHEVRLSHLQDLSFDMDFGFAGYAEWKPLEPGIEAVLTDIEWCQHLVMVHPMWWGGLPAKLKGLFDRILLPGRAFDTRNTNWMGMPSPLLGGRTARVIMTSDTPGWFLRFVYGNGVWRQTRQQILAFVGIRPARLTHFSGASGPRPGAAERWLKTVRALGARAA